MRTQWCFLAVAVLMLFALPMAAQATGEGFAPVSAYEVPVVSAGVGLKSSAITAPGGGDGGTVIGVRTSNLESNNSNHVVVADSQPHNVNCLHGGLGVVALQLHLEEY